MKFDGLPDGHAPDEFSLEISWLPGDRTPGGDSLPGWRLRAYFANEGTACSALGGGVHNWREAKRLRPQTLTNVLTTLALDPEVPGDLMNLGGPLAHYADEAMRKRHVNMVQKARRLREELAAAEAALEAEGIPRDA